MTIRFKIFIKIIVILFFFSTTRIQAQILKDTSSVNLVKKCIDCIYNYRFKDASEVCNKIRQAFPDHPATFLLNGMLTYWENFPLIPASPARASYEEDMRTCIRLCEKKYAPADEAEYLLTNLCARGMLLLFYSDNELSLDVFPLATSTYKYIRRSFDFTTVYPDFLFFAGLYDFYREAYPEVYPVYKPLAILFPKGDKSKGIKELQIAAKNSIVLKAESYSFLSAIFLSFERNFQQSTYYNKSLFDLYPANLQYLGEYIKNLLLLKQYNEAEGLINSRGSKLTNPYFQAEFTIFNGILQEKKYHDYNLAHEFYIKGVKDISLFGAYGNEFAAYAYFGLSRISEADGDKHYKKIYRKLANELAVFRKIDFD